MSTLTLPDVLAADPVPVRRSAVAWAALAEDLDNSYEQFIRGVKYVDRGVAGQAALAAIRDLVEQGHRLSNAVNPARRIGDALDRHAYGLETLRGLLHAVDHDARVNGLIFNWTTGHLVAPPTVMKLDEPPVWQPMLNRLRGELLEILDRARRLDDDTAAVIRRCLPSTTGDGFGVELSPYVGHDAVAAMGDRSPDEVHAWWLGLSPEQQEQVLRDHPDLVGWYDGVPATDRDRANRVMLDRQLQLADNQTDLAGLREVRDKLAQLGAPALLMGIDGRGDGRAVIALNDPDTARHTAVFVPGATTDLRDTGGYMDRVRNLRDAADLMTPARDDASVVYWLGYDAPGALDSIGYGASRDGGQAFVPFVDGLRATHQPDVNAYHVTAIGHSYGSTVVAEAALHGDLHVDDIITAGSPGMHTDRAADLHIDPRHVWAGLADDDPIGGWLGSIPFVHGNEPSDGDFGANQYVVDTQGHGGYWSPDSVSLSNQAAIVVGQYGLVSLQHGSPPSP